VTDLSPLCTFVIHLLDLLQLCTYSPAIRNDAIVIENDHGVIDWRLWRVIDVPVEQDCNGSLRVDGQILKELVSVQKLIQNVYDVPSAYRVAIVRVPAPPNLHPLVEALCIRQTIVLMERDAR
jgi:hypothetical protein